MPTKITYYAIVDDFSSREEPAGVLRRTEDDEGSTTRRSREAWNGNAAGSLYSYERGNGDAKFYEISEEEADRIVERIRRSVTGQP